MNTRWLTTLVLGLTLAGPLVHAQTRLDAHRTLGAPHTFQNLTLFPVYNPDARATNAYITLDEGLKAKTVQVQESQDGGDVNTLYVTNLGTKPVYLMAGEVVLGGQQDRCLGQDHVIASGAKRTPVTVFCVEHGRWTGRADFESSAPTVASGDIRLKAQESNFYAERAVAQSAAHAEGRASASASGVEGRIANVPVDSAAAVAGSSRVSSGQQGVWDKVAAKNARFKTESSTGTYRNTLTLAGGDAKRSIPAYDRALESSLGSDPHLIGVVACVNGKVIACDLFDDPALFHKLWPKLLRSYAADAVEKAPGKGGKARTVTADQVKAFYVAATDAKTTIENRSEASTMLRLESKDATTYRLMSKKQAAGGAAGPLHEAVLHK
jgi:hypothetical protein